MESKPEKPESNDEILKKLDATLKSIRSVSSTTRRSPAEDGYDPICGGKTYWIQETTWTSKPDLKKQVKAAQELAELLSEGGSDSSELRNLAREHYRKTEVREVGLALGSALGYSRARIWAERSAIGIGRGLIRSWEGIAGLAFYAVVGLVCVLLIQSCD